MTVTLILRPEIEAQVTAEAQARGVPVADYLQQYLEAMIPQHTQEEIHRRNRERNAPALALLEKWGTEADPEVIREQRETLEYLSNALDEDRPGQRSIFGTGINTGRRTMP